MPARGPAPACGSTAISSAATSWSVTAASSAVIDWGPLTVGDPAPDVAPGVDAVRERGPTTYREQLAVDDATWARARAWVMLPALAGIRDHQKTMPAFSQAPGGISTAVLADVSVQTTR